jgi:hypothetical protein
MNNAVFNRYANNSNQPHQAAATASIEMMDRALVTGNDNRYNVPVNNYYGNNYTNNNNAAVIPVAQIIVPKY